MSAIAGWLWDSASHYGLQESARSDRVSTIGSASCLPVVFEQLIGASMIVARRIEWPGNTRCIPLPSDPAPLGSEKDGGALDALFTPHSMVELLEATGALEGNPGSGLFLREDDVIELQMELASGEPVERKIGV
jgi:hypothetical protein